MRPCSLARTRYQSTRRPNCRMRPSSTVLSGGNCDGRRAAPVASTGTTELSAVMLGGSTGTDGTFPGAPEPARKTGQVQFPCIY